MRLAEAVPVEREARAEAHERQFTHQNLVVVHVARVEPQETAPVNLVAPTRGETTENPVRAKSVDAGDNKYLKTETET